MAEEAEIPKTKKTTLLRHFLKPYEPWLKFPNHSHVRGALYQKYKFDVATQFDTGLQMLKALYEHVRNKFPSDLELQTESSLPMPNIRRTSGSRGLTLPCSVTGVRRYTPVTEREWCNAEEDIPFDLSAIYELLREEEEEDDDDYNYDLEELVLETMRDWSYNLETSDSEIDYEATSEPDEDWGNAEYEITMDSDTRQEARNTIANWLLQNHPNATITPEYILNRIRAVAV